MVGEGVEGNPRGRMLDMFGGIRNFKENGSKRNRTRKDSGFFFFFLQSYRVACMVLI